MTSPTQETTSVYYNNIIRKNIRPISVDKLDLGILDDFYNKMRLAFPNEDEDYIFRVKYLVPYILQNIDWDEYGIPLEDWQLKYYYQRERFLQKTGLDMTEFMSHEPLQTSIHKLDLEPEPVFEFILFLKYYYGLRSDLRYSCVEQLDRLKQELKSFTDSNVSMDVNVGGKHFKISDSDFIRVLFNSIDEGSLRSGNFVNDFNQGSPRDKIRALDYYIIKTLLDYLPTNKSYRRGGNYSQYERNFGLSVLSFLGRLADIDRVGECGSENNATFDKLMRDFKSVPIPFAMELFL